MKDRGLSRPLFVTDKTLAKLEVCQRLIKNLEKHHFSPIVFDQATGNPVESHVVQGLAEFKNQRADSIIMFGGGCALDVGKAIGLMVHHPGNLFDYEDGKCSDSAISNNIPYTIAIPTTAGTGSEVGGSSVISKDDSKQKVIIWSKHLIPKVVIANPEYTYDLPKPITASTGIDALVHNIEAYLAKSYHPICDGIALQGIKLISSSLVQAFQQGQSYEHRANMLMASMMGAIAFQKGLGVTHSCAHALSTRYDLHHGLANAVMLVPCLEFNLDQCEKKYSEMAKVVNNSNSQTHAPKSFINWIIRLKEELGLSQNLESLGISPDALLIDLALQDPCHQNNPKVCLRSDFEAIFSNA